MTLFEELVNLLGNNVEIATIEGTEKLFQAFVEKYPVTRWGRIDWGVLKEKYETASIEGAAEIIDTKLKNSRLQKVNVLWNYSDAPSVQVELDQVINFIDDFITVGSDTWIVGLDFSFVIEFFHEGEITLGFLSL